MHESQFPPGDFRAPLPTIAPGHSFRSINDKLTSIVLTKNTPLVWFIVTGIAFMFLMGLTVAIAYLLAKGIGIWGNNIPVGWAFDIINFVWWIGIGHAGTLISAILLLFKQDWRTSINRFSEAMTLFAVLCAALFPLIHTGRPWLAIYWLFPYPNAMTLWPNFRSPLIWDVFAVTTYGTVSLLFWSTGLIPDMAAFRDKTANPFLKKLFGVLSLGWRGSARHWARYEKAYLLLAGLSTPLVLSVHTVVSFDFAVSNVPGWHATFFPPYFVAGAIYSGFAMVMTLAVPMRAAFKLDDLITMRHIHNMTKIMLATGMIVAYAYVNEVFYAWYSGNLYEQFMMQNRQTGPFGPFYWMLIAINACMIQLFWFRKVRDNVVLLFILSLLVNVGMWLERFVIIVVSLHRDFLPSSWDMYAPTRWDFGMFTGTIGLFLSLFFLFVRLLPAISIFEVRTLVPEARLKHGAASEHLL